LLNNKYAIGAKGATGGRLVMTKKTVLSVFGTRPEAIKMAPLVKELERRPEFKSVICVTAQHRDMLDQVLEIFDIAPDFDLDIMKERQTLSDITAAALKGVEKVIKEVAPDLVLVHGDTSTTFAASLAAFYNKTTVGHVEAGLRTYDKYQPFPEEANRVLTTCLADLYFAPTQTSRENLLKENVPSNKIFVTGNTAIDCINYTVSENHIFNEKILNKTDFKKKIICVTAHRRENWGAPLINICRELLKIANSNPDVILIYSVHPNPVVKNTAEKFLGNNPRIILTPPLDIKDMHNLIARSYIVLTDSGGLQEESPRLNKPVVVLRNVTERPEGVAAGVLKLAGTDKIAGVANELLRDEALYKKMAESKNPFGDGFASKRIAEAILFAFGISKTRPEDFY
jgi:UDP-N-acetylglucosamine 2-epimerase